MNALCPTCSGPRIVGHSAGFVWDHRSDCAVRDQEDATAVADHERARGRSLTRPTTEAELVLLAACGVTVPQPPLTTVDPLTASVLRRTFGVTLDPTGDTAA